MSLATLASEELARLDEAADSVRAQFGQIPSILVVAGSGLGTFANSLTEAVSVGYGDLRHFPVSTVVGHAGTLVKGKVGGKVVLVMNGRKHLYEGVDTKTATLPLRALLRAGVKIVILSNAAGCLNVRYAAGDLMMITDHVNNMNRNPLIGPNLDVMGPRFPDMSEPYCRRLQDLARKVAVRDGLVLREGVYVGNLGPTYETQAEVGMLRQFADAVGMSTVPETTAAIHAGARVLGISLLSNSLVHRSDAVTTHEEVMEAGKAAAETFRKLVGAVIAELPE